MNFFIHTFIFVLPLFYSQSLCAQELNDSEYYNQFVNLADEIVSLPIPVVSSDGNPFYIQLSENGDLVFSGGAITDTAGAPAIIPGNAIITPVYRKKGHYIFEYVEGSAVLVRLGEVENKRIVLGPAVSTDLPRGSLVARGDGPVTFLHGGTGGPFRIAFDAYRINGLTVSRNPQATNRLINGQFIRLGSVRDPLSDQYGEAILEIGEKEIVRIVFASRPDLEIEIANGIFAFAAAPDTLIVGLYSPDCAPSSGLPNGICTPFLFAVPIPASNMKVDLEFLSNLSPLNSPRSGLTFGALHRTSEPSDFSVVGDRLYTIGYAGMRQTLAYISLTNPKDYGTVIPMEDGTDLAFQFPLNNVHPDGLFIEKRHATRPLQILHVAPEGRSETIFEAPLTPTLSSMNLAFRRYPARPAQLLAPMVVVGSQSIVNANPCSGGLALVEIYGGHRTALAPSNPLGLIPELFSKGGVHVIVDIPGSGGYGLEWSDLGVYENSPNQVRSLAQSLAVLRRNGCDKIVLTGFSHGGIVALSTAISFPELVDNVIVGGTPLDLRGELAAGNKSIAAFLPRGEKVLSNDQYEASTEVDALSYVSPADLAKRAMNLDGLKIYLMVGSEDRKSVTFQSQKTIKELRDKGATVELIIREGVGHYKFMTSREWSEYYMHVSRAISD